MDWNNDLCLQLIKHYKEYRRLWDPTCGEYKNNLKKEDDWNAIGNIMNCRADELKKKMDSLQASYRRERQKSMRSRTGSGPNRYKSKWFAYSSMQFLLERYKPRSTIKFTQNDTVERAQIEAQNTTNNHTETSSRRKELKSQGKRKISDDLTVDETYRMLKETISYRNVRDESSVFSEYVATKHRKYNAYTKSTVEHLISNILYEADLGKYNDSCPTPSPLSSLHPEPSPSYLQDHETKDINQYILPVSYEPMAAE